MSLITRLKNNEHYDFFMNIVDFVKDCVSAIPEIAVLWASFMKQFTKEGEIFKRSAMAVETKYIKEANLRRSGAYMLIRRSIEAASYSPDSKKKNASEKLGEVLRNYKSIASVAMTEVTALVANMIEDFRKPRYSGSVTELGLVDAVSSLEEVNNEFKEIYKERVLNMETSEVQGTMTYIRPIVDKAFKVFVDGINTHYSEGKLSGIPDDKNPYYKVIMFINGYIDQYERIYAHRTPGHTTTGKDKPAAGDEEDETIPVPALAISSQVIESASRMLLVMADPQAFTTALYPTAGGGTLVLSSDTFTDYPNFPITDFEMDGQRPIGLIVAPPKDDLSFNKPLYSAGPCRAEVIKDDTLMATITGMEWPASYSN
jgi:hypothetical protein